MSNKVKLEHHEEVEKFLDDIADDVARERNIKMEEKSEPDRDRDRHRRSDRDRFRERDRFEDRGYRESKEDGRDSADRERRQRDGSRPRSSRDADTEEGSNWQRHRSRSRERGYGGRGHGRGGDYYRGGRSRSPAHRDRRDRVRSPQPRRDRDDDRRGSNRRRTSTPEINEDDRDKRTVFVQQISARCEQRHLRQFFEAVGPVVEAQIVKDRVTGRSKGVGYVEFKDEESVPKAVEMTGKKLKGVPIIASLTEAEKNRVARVTSGEGGATTSNNNAPFHRLFVGNVHFSVTEQDLEDIFVPFGQLEEVKLMRDVEMPQRSKGYGFVQFVDPNHAKTALLEMNGFELAGRQIRVGLGNDKFTPESTAHLLRNFPQQVSAWQGSAFSGAGGRGAYAGGSGGVYDRAHGKDDRGANGASALDDSEVGGVNFKTYDRNKLMANLARRDETVVPAAKEPPAAQRRAPVIDKISSRCIKIENAFNADAELQNTGPKWVSELQADVEQECTNKYGKVVHIAVDPNSDGDIYVKFDKLDGALKAMQGLNGRLFNGRPLRASPVVEMVYNSIHAAAANV